MIDFAIARVLLGSLLLGLWLPCPVSFAETPQNDSPVDGSLGDSVWYDADRDEVLPVFVKPIVDDSLNRDSRWLPKAKRIKQPPISPTANPTGGTGTTSGFFGSGLTIGNLFGWMLLIAIIVGAVGAIAYALSKTEVDFGVYSRSKPKNGANTPDDQTIERMKHLPAELRRTDVNLRSEAERLMNEGEYDQAIILLFGHQLLLLDRVGMLRLNRGKTNRKYVRETRSLDPESAERLQGTVTAFERSYFGRHVITAGEFGDLWRTNAELEQALERWREVAA